MGKIPAYQFYPADYLRDTRALSLSAKGAWSDLLCFMWGAQNRGMLTDSVLGFSRMFGVTVEQTVAIFAELCERHICCLFSDVDESSNEYHANITLASHAKCVRAFTIVQNHHANITVLNRRMVREEKDRKNAADRAQRYRDANPRHGPVTDESREHHNASSSSSSYEEPPTPTSGGESRVSHSSKNSRLQGANPRANGTNPRAVLAQQAAEAALAWQEVLELVSRGGRYTKPQYSSPPVADAVRDIGGFSSICDAKTFDLPVLKGKFVAAYQTAKNRTP